MDPIRPGLKPAVFRGGPTGRFAVRSIAAIIGDSLPAVACVDVVGGFAAATTAADGWTLRGVAGHSRYVVAAERSALDAVSPPLDRPDATRAILIPIRKSPAWWTLSQDERRAIFEEQSHHIAASMKYLPRIARRLYHARDLGEPFDFLTWFEMAPEHEHAFDELLEVLRATEEWKFVDREVEVRLERRDP